MSQDDKFELLVTRNVEKFIFALHQGACFVRLTINGEPVVEIIGKSHGLPDLYICRDAPIYFSCIENSSGLKVK